jgi:hypothetical protein
MKLRKFSDDRGAGSGCMARLVRISSFVGRHVLMGVGVLTFVFLVSAAFGIVWGVLLGALEVVLGIP